MNSQWPTWIALGVAAGLAVTSWRLRSRILSYQAETRRLKEKIRDLENLRDAGAQLDSLLVEVNEAVVRLDRNGQVRAANPAACDILGIDKKKLPAPMVQFYRDTEWHEQLKSALQKLPERTLLPELQTGEHVLTPRIAQLSDGEALLLCMDITEQHRLERQRRTFISNLMHDLKTPLTSLLGYARSMAQFGDDTDFRNEAAHVIAEESKHVNQLLDALLTLDQAEYGVRYDQPCSEAAEVIEHICNMLTPQCAEKQITLKFKNKADADIRVTMDEEDLDRIVTNLLANAIAYSPEKTTVRVSMQLRDNRCRIAIKDEGPGIPEHEIPRVTERFYRIDKARTRNNNGHGLGLAIVKEMLEVNGGELSLSNREPNGLLAAFTLPLCPDDTENKV